ncbi:MAG TPA: phosphoenolpyruvate carboxylase, partial [Nitriliruptoraceae bacterium]|nr:phosphoenolpyruvate carboxylase [Nitriliruptoraceae bacterium]
MVDVDAVLDDPELAAVDRGLRGDIRRLGVELGRSLLRQEGQELYDLVEQIRALTRQAPETAGAAADDPEAPGADDDDHEARARLGELLAGIDAEVAIRLVRAFTAYFHLATVAEQSHRVELLRAPDESGRGWFAATVDKVASSGMRPEEITGILSNLQVRPVVTAHPTEATRRSILSKLAAIADLVEQRRDPRISGTDRDRIDRRTAELVDLLWQTDELRVERPRVVDEASSALFYVEQTLREVLPSLLDDVGAELARLDVELPSTMAPVRFGSWVGGDRDGNPFVTPEVTDAVLVSMHERGIGLIEQVLLRLGQRLSPSTRIRPASGALMASLAADRSVMPQVWRRLAHLNAQEPYRLKVSYCLERLRATRLRIQEGRDHTDGVDYLDANGLLEDLALIRDSLADNGGDLIAAGVV